MERLYAQVLLWFHGFNDKNNYESLLNEVFLSDPDNNFLLRLQEHSSNLLDTRGLFSHYLEYENKDFKHDVFGKSLFEGLELVYKSASFSIKVFDRKCYQLWTDLPSEIIQVEPFWTLSYAGECLTWNDEEQTKKLYENAFAFYKNRAI